MLNFPFILFILAFLSAIGFFNPMGLMSGSLGKMLYCFFSVAAIMWGIFFGRKLSDVYYPRRIYWLLLASIAFSVFMASGFHDQSLKVSIMTTLPLMFSYLLFWSMMKLNVTEEQVIRFCLVISLISIPIYFANAATFPNFMFGGTTEKGEDFSRGILRIPVFNLNIICMMVFYSINRVMLNRRKLFWTIIGCLMALMVVLSVWRQNIAITFGLSFIFIFIHTSWIKRIVMVLIAVSAVTFVPKIPMFKAMIELSEDQSDANDEDEDIRIYDYKYFGYEFQTNDVTRVFGNGMPSFGNSVWGNAMENEWFALGTYPPDTGWVGFYWCYGAIAVLCILALFIISAVREKRPDQKYLTYTFLMYILLQIASGSILRADEAVSISVALFLLYGTGNNEVPVVGKDTVTPRRRLTLFDYHNT